jgi:hypothetical protein
MATQWLVWALALLHLGFVAAGATFALAAARGAWRRELDFGGVRRLHPGSVLRLRGAVAVIAGGLIATVVGTYVAVISLGLLNTIRDLLSR